VTVRLFYTDESYDDEKFCLSAISVRHHDWRDVFNLVREHRQELKTDFGMYLRKEIHAHEFVAGRGRVAPKVIGKWQRSRIFLDLLRLVARLPHVYVINVCLDVADHDDVELTAWDRLLNRIERTMLEYERRELPARRRVTDAARAALSDADYQFLDTRLNAYTPRAMVFADEGREKEITRIMRKMGVFNPIPSARGVWASGTATKNIPLQRIIEDPIFKPSDQSFLIQLADCVAFSLLKRETAPTPLVMKYNLDEMFDEAVAPVCFKQASPADPLGIVRK
jgi:hypothetical protein